MCRSGNKGVLYITSVGGALDSCASPCTLEMGEVLPEISTLFSCTNYSGRIPVLCYLTYHKTGMLIIYWILPSIDNQNLKSFQSTHKSVCSRL